MFLVNMLRGGCEWGETSVLILDTACKALAHKNFSPKIRGKDIDAVRYLGGRELDLRRYLACWQPRLLADRHSENIDSFPAPSAIH